MMHGLTIAFTAGAALLGAVAQPGGIELPFGETPAELAEPDARVVVSNCSACHSLDYITTQPRGKGEQFWRDSVTKMINVYKAPLSEDEAETVTAVLARKFG
jgi:predicted secreted protein